MISLLEKIDYIFDLVFSIVLSGLSAPFSGILYSTLLFCLFSSAPLSGSILHVWAWQPSQEANGKKLNNWNSCYYLFSMCAINVCIAIHSNQSIKFLLLLLFSPIHVGIVHDALKTERENKNTWLSGNNMWMLIRWKMKRIFLN